MATELKKIDFKKLSQPSINFLFYKNPNGFRPLLLQSSQYGCTPFIKQHNAIQTELAVAEQELSQIKARLTHQYILDEIDRMEERFESLQKYYQELVAANEKIEEIYSTQGELQALSEKLIIARKAKKENNYTIMNISGFDYNHPEYRKQEEVIAKIKNSSKLDTTQGTCAACGISLPNSMEKHIDFVSKKEFTLCPYCHACEHLDSINNESGTMAYIPYVSQEMINIFYHTFYMLKYALEGDAKEQKLVADILHEYNAKFIDINSKVSLEREQMTVLQQKVKAALKMKPDVELSLEQIHSTLSETDYAEYIKFKREVDKADAEIDNLNNEYNQDERLKFNRQRESLKGRSINRNAINFTYEELLLQMYSLDKIFHQGEDILISYFNYKANFNFDNLKREYENRIGEEIEDFHAFLNQENGVFGRVADSTATEKLFSYNIDAPNSPYFFGSLFLRFGINQQSNLTFEQKLNVLTRISGVRYIPNFEFYKKLIKGWIGYHLNADFERHLDSFVGTNLELFHSNEFAKKIMELNKQKDELLKQKAEANKAKLTSENSANTNANASTNATPAATTTTSNIQTETATTTDANVNNIAEELKQQENETNEIISSAEQQQPQVEVENLQANQRKQDQDLLAELQETEQEEQNNYEEPNEF